MMRLLHIISIFCIALCTAPVMAKRLTETGLVPWSYDGDTDGQSDWGVLSTAYAACELGLAQSPIRISYTVPSTKAPLDIRYLSSKATVRYDGHMIIADTDNAGTLVDGGREYRLTSIMLHSPSEHTVEGTFYPLEIEMLHEDKEGHRLMLSVFGETGDASNAAIENLTNVPVEVTLDPSGLLPVKRGYYAYSGSLPFPPCTENVEWRIFKEPISISKEQLAKITGLIGRNARLPQPVYSRTVEVTAD